MMTEFSLHAPQIGEAIHKVCIVRYLKQVGDPVSLDEPLVIVESEKAAFEIESPVSGVVSELLHGEGSAVEVGAVILKLSLPGEGILMTSPSTPAADEAAASPVQALDGMLSQLRNGTLSPRQRFALQQARNAAPDQVDSPPVPARLDNPAYTQQVLSPARQQLNRALSASCREVVAANLQLSCPMAPLQQVRQACRQQTGMIVPSRLELIAWAVLQAMQDHPATCARLLEDGVLRQQNNPALGLAVALPGDELATGVVASAGLTGFAIFRDACRQAVAEARRNPAVPAYHSLAISDLSSYGIEDAIPVVVAPAMATLFVGAPRLDGAGEKTFRLSFSFDHRILNGAGAAVFLQDVRRRLSSATRLQTSLVETRQRQAA